MEYLFAAVIGVVLLAGCVVISGGIGFVLALRQFRSSPKIVTVTAKLNPPDPEHIIVMVARTGLHTGTFARIQWVPQGHERVIDIRWMGAKLDFRTLSDALNEGLTDSGQTVAMAPSDLTQAV